MKKVALLNVLYRLGEHYDRNQQFRNADRALRLCQMVQDAPSSLSDEELAYYLGNSEKVPESIKAKNHWVPMNSAGVPLTGLKTKNRNGEFDGFVSLDEVKKQVQFEQLLRAEQERQQAREQVEEPQRDSAPRNYDFSNTQFAPAM